jgi:hypothetical protein
MIKIENVSWGNNFVIYIQTKKLEDSENHEVQKMEAPGTFIMHQSIMVSFVFSVKKIVNCEWTQKYQTSPSHLDCSLHLIFKNLKPTKIYSFISTTINWNKPQNFVQKNPFSLLLCFYEDHPSGNKNGKIFMKNFYFPLLCEN